MRRRKRLLTLAVAYILYISTTYNVYNILTYNYTLKHSIIHARIIIYKNALSEKWLVLYRGNFALNLSHFTIRQENKLLCMCSHCSQKKPHSLWLSHLECARELSGMYITILLYKYIIEYNILYRYKYSRTPCFASRKTSSQGRAHLLLSFNY